MTYVDMLKSNKMLSSLNIILMSVVAVFSSANNYITILLVSALQRKSSISFFSLVGFEVVICIICYSCSNFSGYFIEKQIQEYLSNIRLKLFKNTFTQKDSVDISDLQNNSINNLQQLGKEYFFSFFTILSGMINIVMIFFTVSSINIWLSLFILITASTTVASSKIFSDKIAQVVKNESCAKGVLIKEVANWIPTLALTREYKKEKVVYKNILYQSSKLEDAKISKSKITESNNFFIDNISNIVETMLLIFVAYLIYRNTLKIGVYAAVGSFLYSTLGSIKSISSSLSQIKGSSFIRKEINQKLQVNKAQEYKSLNDFNILRCTDLSVHFKNGETIKYPNFSIKKGEKVLLVGDSGVGKSTLLKVILGLEKKATGNVDFISSAGEKFIPNLDEIGYISQTSVLLPGSIRDNITMFSHDRNTTNKTNEYVKKMCFSVDISSFSEGLDTQIKSNDENWLSGGQKQKIILIRNSMFDRPIFLIDEATSAIDEAARVQVIKEFLNTSATVLWIEHNLNKKITNLFDRQIYLRK